MKHRVTVHYGGRIFTAVGDTPEQAKQELAYQMCKMMKARK